MKILIVAESIKLSKKIEGHFNGKGEIRIKYNPMDAIVSFKKALEEEEGYDYIFIGGELGMIDIKLFIRELKKLEKKYLSSKISRIMEVSEKEVKVKKKSIRQ